LIGDTIESILVGHCEGKELVYAGKVHGGLNRYNRKQLASVVARLPIGPCPFVNLPDRRPDRWGQGITASDMDRYVGETCGHGANRVYGVDNGWTIAAPAL
jgi:hypothetical protein